MSLVHASQRATCLRSSYLEISRFFRTRRHGITSAYAITCSHQWTRPLSVSRSLRNSIQPSEQLRETLEEFKATIRSTPWSGIEKSYRTQASKLDPSGVEIELCGYISTRRDVNKKLAFTILRSTRQDWCIQLVSTSNTEGKKAEAHERLRSLREWTPVLVRGTLKAREAAKTSYHNGIKLVTDHELVVEHVESLNQIAEDVIIKQDAVFGPEQRHLQLRTSAQLRDNILFRARTVHAARTHLTEGLWEEIETPILFKSTPEGAREFLVPTRQRGLAYALPQSPQQYKQILMASGFTKYFQFARCFRDEDLRADRQPEFTQLDMEMAYAGEEDVMAETEQLLKKIWKEELKLHIGEIPRMTYQEAMASYGSDKPDLRYKATIHNITQYLSADLISKISPLQDPVVDSIKIPVSSDPKKTRKFIASFLDSPDGKAYLGNPHGQPGIFVGDLSQPMQGLGPLGYQYIMEGPENLTVSHGDLLILQARPNAPFSGGSTVLGNLRLALYKAAIAQELIEAPNPHDFQFLWITDFPLFTPNNDSDPGQGGASGFSSTHHPFTAPKTPADVDLLLTDPLRATAAHYDIVVNGVELGGGSRRIHNATVQEFIFRDVLQMHPHRIVDFRHLLHVLRSGCPPHAGLALGWDRLMAVMRGAESVRDVIAFPKTGRGEDALVKSPNRLSEGQLDTYHLKLK